MIDRSDQEREVSYLFRLGGVGYLTPQQQMQILRMFWVLAITFHVCWVCGWLTRIGLQPPFAQEQELIEFNGKITESNKKIQDQLGSLFSETHDSRNERIEEEIGLARKGLCHAAPGELRDQYSGKLEELIKYYGKINDGKLPRVPGCDEL